MQVLIASAVFLFAGITPLIGGAQSFTRCLPKDTKSSDVVSAEQVRTSIKKITVAQKLTQLRASCKTGKLVDSAGKEIRFYRLEGCWGNPPADYQEILQKQRVELEKLRKQFTVIEITCNPDGTSIH